LLIVLKLEITESNQKLEEDIAMNKNIEELVEYLTIAKVTTIPFGKKASNIH
jgi:hypothetical protein